MSNFTTVYDLLVGTTIPGLTGFSTKTKIPDPYNPEDNDINFLRNGWGLTIGESSDSEFQEFKYSKVNQVFNLVLTREVNRTSNNTATVESVSKAMAEDIVTARLDLLDDDQITLDSNIEMITFEGSSAIEPLDLEDSYVLSTTVTFNFVLRESL